MPDADRPPYLPLPPLGALARRTFVQGVLTPTIASVPQITHRLPRGRRRLVGLRVDRDVRYADDDPAQRLDVIRLDHDDQVRPALVYVHGGGFMACSKKTHISIAIAFARRGFVVFNLDYRLAPRHRFPAAFDDVSAALRWIDAHAAAYGADPARLVLAGESAGANLILGAAVAGAYRLDRPSARALFDQGIAPVAALPACGILQVSDVARLWHERPEIPPFVRQLLRAMEEAYLGPGRHTPGAEPLADPLVLLETRAPERPLPPVFAFAGSEDPVMADTVRLEAALGHDGAAGATRIYDGEPHAFHALPWRPKAQECWNAMDAFLDTHAPR
ncbi:MAG: alpha/beta hydrolase fold domain-containing protein [Myxococcales bacterium]|nr:alpha/beta hydrolase fold domain-containing protein [Myxococcales bacterium]